MGDAADDAFDAGYYYELEDGEPYLKNKWRDAQGTLWDMSDMTESHIKNCINHCIRLNNIQKLQEFRDELSRRNISEDNGYTDYLKRIGQYQ